MEMRKNEKFTVRIQDISEDGAGIGKVDGYIWFIKDTVIGDLVEAGVMKTKKSYGFARVLRILEPSPFRVEPKCPVARACGGCSLQAMDYEEQLRFKERKIRDALERIGGVEGLALPERGGSDEIGISGEAGMSREAGDSVLCTATEAVVRAEAVAGGSIDGSTARVRDLRVEMEPTIGMEDPWRYRNKAQFPVGKDKNGRIIFGFYAGRTHSIIENEDCLLGVEENKEILKKVRAYMERYHIDPYDEASHRGLVRHVLIRKGFRTGEMMVCLVINGETLPHGEWLVERLTGAAGAGERSGKSLERSAGEQSGKLLVGSAGERSGKLLMGSAGERPRKSPEGSTGERPGKSLVGSAGDCPGKSMEESAGECPEKSLVGSAAGRLETAIGLSEGCTKKWGSVTAVSYNINTDRTNVILGSRVVDLYGPGYITDYIGDIRYQISPQSFYQVNPVQTEKLYRTALEYAGLTGEEIVWDLYCGIGTISLFLARRAKKVYGVEIVPAAIEDARRNAALNGIENTEFFVGKVEEVLPREYRERKTRADVIVVDPPRKGCDKVCLDTIVEMGPKRVVYVSCDPATLGRDVKYLGEKGYGVERVRGCDMFAGTGHVETVVLLSHKLPDSISM